MKLHDPALDVLAKQVEDLERLRIASAHRYRLLTTEAVDEKGVVRGLSLPEDDKDALRLKEILEDIEDIESDAIKQLQSYMRRGPWGPWLKTATGVGEKQLARLLAEIGDPFWHTLENRPREVSELWAYAGYHVLPVEAKTNSENHKNDASTGVITHIAPRRQRGVQCNWSEKARMRAWLIATSCVKSKGHYRDVYDKARAHYDQATHKIPCVRCGPSGKPAQPGSALSAGHQHARALRRIAKEVLKDLWIEAKRLHELHEGKLAS